MTINNFLTLMKKCLFIIGILLYTWTPNLGGPGTICAPFPLLRLVQTLFVTIFPTKGLKTLKLLKVVVRQIEKFSNQCTLSKKEKSTKQKLPPFFARCATLFLNFWTSNIF